MESLKHTIFELRDHFDTKMAEFQKNLQSASIPATSPISNIAAQFSVFRSFVMGALEGLQLQLGLLAGKYDELEMKSRRKILLVHGIQESKSDKLVSGTVKILSEHLKVPELKVEDMSRCHRLGRSSSDKPRAILIKFRDIDLRNKVWFSKINLRNTGITISEFLTKERHEVFVAARQQFGISKCWTKNGTVVVLESHGTKRRISTMAELKSLASSTDITEVNTAPTASTSCGTLASKDLKISNIRSKRTVKK